MGYDPIVKSGSDPKAVDTAGDNGKQEPLDPIAEELSARTVKGKSLAVNKGVADDELPHIADSPRSADAAGDRNNKTCYDRVYNGVKNTAIPAGGGNGSRCKSS